MEPLHVVELPPAADGYGPGGYQDRCNGKEKDKDKHEKHLANASGVDQPDYDTPTGQQSQTGPLSVSVILLSVSAGHYRESVGW